MQFLMGLSNAYDHVRSQVLLMDPLPTVGKAYSRFLRVEKQRRCIREFLEECVMATQFGEITDKFPQRTVKRRGLRISWNRGGRNGRPPNARVHECATGGMEKASIQGTSAVRNTKHISALVRIEDLQKTVAGRSEIFTRAFKCVFLGYAHGRKGYKVMDLETENIHIARDVVFHETTFSFHNMTESEVLCPLPMISQDEEIRNLQDIEHVKETVEDLKLNRNSPSSEGIIFLQEPKDFCEAQEKQEWREGYASKKLMRLERNKTWEISYLPQGKNAIGCRWIYKIKLRPDGTIERCKARLVAKGFSQVEGIDYNDCFAPIAKQSLHPDNGIKSSLIRLKLMHSYNLVMIIAYLSRISLMEDKRSKQRWKDLLQKQNTEVWRPQPVKSLRVVITIWNSHWKLANELEHALIVAVLQIAGGPMGSAICWPRNADNSL
ncbi:UNVERIFIED_CONTAM: hypothetical protein Scaly_2941900 [Sesamum calycinum]|uniref:Reverse transcriptase Ty1/copia-type domain-containing protein n=1 Tax=Sesamum calycinum TaxID=2727403 RepID=A0AAW2KTQ9_9LAMI